jgi:hypothetical protein
MNPIVANAARILSKLVASDQGHVRPDEIAELTGLRPEEINDAVEYLEDLGAVEIVRYLGTAPYTFGGVHVGSRGRYLHYELERQQGEADVAKEPALPARPVNPVGSPYGFTDQDWEFVALRHADSETLYVVFGLQFESQYYQLEALLQSVWQRFLEALQAYNSARRRSGVELVFEKLAAGYGEHLFNTIARSIIGSDIAVFEVSDRNPNVMIELGVALTWGVRVLPLREGASPEPPSDISGQTWVKYLNSGAQILDDDFEPKLQQMVQRALAKKRPS